MFPSQVGSYNDDDLIGTTETTAEDNFDPGHPLYTSVAALAKLAKDHPALRDGAQQHRLSSGGAGVYAFSRIDRSEQREYVVALNNSESPQSASVPTYSAGMSFSRIYGDGGAATATTSSAKRLSVTVPALSAVVYRAYRAAGAQPVGAVDRARARPHPRPTASRSGADVGGDGFNEVTFLAKAGRGGFKPIGTDDNRPYRVFHDVSGFEPGTKVQYKAVVLDNAGNARTTGARSTRVAEPSIALEAPDEGDKVRSGAEVRAVVTPDDADNVVTFQRRIGTGDWETIGTRLLVAGLHGVRRRPREADGDGDLLPGDRRLRRRHGHERAAQRHRRAAAAADGDRPLPALGRRLRRLGPAPLGRRDRRRRRDRRGSRRGCRRARSPTAPSRSRSRSRTTRRR